MVNNIPRDDLALAMVCLLTHMRRIIQEERLTFLSCAANELSGKITVGVFQMNKIYRLLCDGFPVHQRHGYCTDIAEAITLHIWREAGQIVTRTLYKKDVSMEQCIYGND